MFNKWFIVLTLTTLLINISCKKNTTSSENTAPTASFTVDPSSGTIATIFNFDAGGCTDDEDSVSDLQVRWDWENDGNYDTDFSTTKTTTHQYGTTGTYTVVLEVKDSGGLTQTTTKSVSLSNTDPTASFTINPTSGTTITTFTFDASGSTDEEDETSVLQVKWDWENDGVWDTDYSTAKTETHQYITKGTYTTKLEVMDMEGSTSTSTNIITVSEQTATCIISLEATGNYTATPEDTSPYDYDVSINRILFMVSGSISGNTFTGIREINESGGSIYEAITAVMSDDQETIVNINGTWYSWDASSGGNIKYKSIIATNIPILMDSDYDLFEFQKSGAETCDHITSIEDYAQSTNFGPNYTLNSIDCNSESNINIKFSVE